RELDQLCCPYYSGKRMKEIITLIVLSLSLCVQSQVIEIPQYLDDYMNPVMDQADASYSCALDKTDEAGIHLSVFFLDGNLRMTGIYTNETLAVEHGMFTYFYHGGLKESEGYFKNSFKSGMWKRWDWEGQIRPDRFYPLETPHDIIRKNSAIAAVFPGGYEGLAQYIHDNLEYPNDALRHKIEGEVSIAFVIDCGGVVRNVEIIESSHTYLESAALNLVHGMPVWTPASRAGQSLESKFILPLSFLLSEFVPEAQ
ncbi:MAG: TonB family protein, partial [Litorivivens sp.]